MGIGLPGRLRARFRLGGSVARRKEACWIGYVWLLDTLEFGCLDQRASDCLGSFCLGHLHE